MFQNQDGSSGWFTTDEKVRMSFSQMFLVVRRTGEFLSAVLTVVGDSFMNFQVLSQLKM